MQIFFFKKCLFEHENQFAVQKKTQKIFGGNFKFFFEVGGRARAEWTHPVSRQPRCVVTFFVQIGLRGRTIEKFLPSSSKKC